MSKKQSPIESHRDKDLKLIREKLLTIINGDIDNATMAKTVVEAGKLLSRMHHALQVDKTVQKISEKESKAFKESPLTPSETANLDELIKSG